MPALIAFVWAALVALLSMLFKWLLKYLLSAAAAAGAFGVTYVGINVFVNRFINDIAGSLGGLSSDIYNFVMLCGLGSAFNILISCAVFGFTLNYVNSIKTSIQKL